MKKKLSNCSLGLFWEGFRQCQMIGILSLVVAVFGAAILPIAEAIQRSKSVYYTVTGTDAVWEPWDANPIMLVVLIMAPLMVLILFHFLNKRAASDLYHAMPHKRITHYVSYASAILAWVLIVMVASTLVSIIVCAITSASTSITLIYSTFLPYLCSIFLTCLLIVSGMLLAMSLSGTLFTNILLTVIILFLPRFCISYISQNITGYMPFVLSGVSSDGFFQSNNNLLFHLVTGAEDGHITDVFRPEWQALVYTFLLALLFFAVGAWAFCHRRSEAAGQSAPSRLFQHIYRIIVTMTYCIFVTGSLHAALENDNFSTDWFMFVVLYLVAILIYCTYELITTKRWRNLLRALPGLGIVALLNAGILLGMHVAHDNIVDQRPAVQEIESVSFRYNSSDIVSGDYLSYSQYVDLMSENVEITDPTVISLVSYYLNDNINTWKQGEDQYYNKYYYPTTTNMLSDRQYTEYVVTIRTKNDTLNRIVQIPNSESDSLVSALEENQDFVSAWTTPPTPIDGTLSIDSYTARLLTEDDIVELYQSYLDEREKASFDTVYQGQFESSDPDATFSYAFAHDGSTYTLDCPISATITPKTLQLFYDKIDTAQADEMKAFEQLVQDNRSDISFSISAFSDSKLGRYANYYGEGIALNDSEAYQVLADYMQEGAVQAGKAYASISISVLPDSAEIAYAEMESQTISVLIPIDNDFFSDSRTGSYNMGNFN